MHILDHSTRENAIMYRSSEMNVVKRTLTSYDIAGIKERYKY